MKKSLYEVIDGRQSWQYTISGGDMQLTVCNPGARVNSLKIGGVDIVLGFPTSADYLASGSFAGATIGRVGNRIAKGRFTLDGREYILNINDGQNHLHGGPKGFDKYDFELTEGTDDRLVFRHFSPDGEENYPGNLDFTVTYAICGNELKITFSAESDADTLWNPTNHMYFNLDGEQSGDCLGNLLQINSDFYTPVDEGLIPTGERRFVGDTPFDFRAAKPIGRDIGDEALKGVGGYDHNYILNGSAAAYAISPKTGIRMDISTDMPCLQFYSGGALKVSKGKTHTYGRYSGFCLEPQYCPNAINMEGYDKPILKAGQKGQHYIIYKFGKES